MLDRLLDAYTDSLVDHPWRTTIGLVCLILLSLPLGEYVARVVTP